MRSLRRRLPRIAALRNSGGFTLVEMMVALLIFGVGIVGLARVLPNGMHTREKARRISVATFLAQEQSEILRGLPFNHADLGVGAHKDPDNPLQTAFARKWEIQDDNPIPGMKRLVVTVSFSTDGPDSQAVITTQLVR